MVMDFLSTFIGLSEDTLSSLNDYQTFLIYGAAVFITCYCFTMLGWFICHLFKR